MKSHRFDGELATAAKDTQQLRLAADYEARRVTAEDAESVVKLALRFVAGIEALYPD